MMQDIDTKLLSDPDKWVRTYRVPPTLLKTSDLIYFDYVQVGDHIRLWDYMRIWEGFYRVDICRYPELKCCVGHIVEPHEYGLYRRFKR